MLKLRYLASSALLLTLVLTGIACGGGGGSSNSGGGGNPGLTASFTGNSNPAANQVALGNGSAAGDTVTIPILIGPINDFFGAAFTLTYDSTRLTFMPGMVDTSATILDDDGTSVDIRASVNPNDANELFVVATRVQGSSTYVGGTDTAVVAELLKITFQATGSIANSAATISGEEARTCNDVAQNCPVDGGVTFLAGSFSAN